MTSSGCKGLQPGVQGGGGQGGPTIAAHVLQARLLSLLRLTDLASRTFRGARNSCPCSKQRSQPSHAM